MPGVHSGPRRRRWPPARRRAIRPIPTYRGHRPPRIIMVNSTVTSLQFGDVSIPSEYSCTQSYSDSLSRSLVRTRYSRVPWYSMFEVARTSSSGASPRRRRTAVRVDSATGATLLVAAVLQSPPPPLQERRGAFTRRRGVVGGRREQAVKRWRQQERLAPWPGLRLPAQAAAQTTSGEWEDGWGVWRGHSIERRGRALQRNVR